MSTIQQAYAEALPGIQVEEHLSSHAAAKLLGVSVGTVLNMVDRGQLLAWRTPGGHRRIAAASVMAHIEAIEERKRSHREHKLRVLVVEDEDLLRAAYQDQFESWGLPIDLRLCANGVEAMLEIGRTPPDILLSDLMMPEIDGFAVVRTLRESDYYDAMDIVVITGLDESEIDAAGGLPEDVVVWHKPVPFVKLRGYLDARLSRAQRRGLA